MTALTPVGRIVDVLAGAGYRRLAVPIKVGSLEFKFAAGFVGTGVSPDLIVVVDAVADNELRAQQQVEGLARTLDSLESKRPLTVIVAGPRFSDAVAQVVSRAGRVLYADDASDASRLNDALAVLLPLSLPEHLVTGAGFDIDVEAVLTSNDPMERQIFEASLVGEDEVSSVLFEWINAPFESGLTEGDQE
ncbi:MAG: hypothetical protein R3C46_11310 [Hyphomonadaceae bacterium]